MRRSAMAATAVLIGGILAQAQVGSAPDAAPVLISAAHASEAARLNPDGSLQLAGQRVACEKVRTRFDRRLDNLGAASPYDRLLVLNPLLLGRERPTVQLFVFHHECGHHRVGVSEIEADCWAVSRGVEAGWLDRKGLDEVCRSFGNAPETRTHPSGKRRCAALDQCFAAANAAKTRKTAESHPAPAASTLAKGGAFPVPALSSLAMRASATGGTPRLVSGPRLVREGTHLR